MTSRSQNSLFYSHCKTSRQTPGDFTWHWRLLLTTNVYRTTPPFPRRRHQTTTHWSSCTQRRI